MEKYLQRGANMVIVERGAKSNIFEVVDIYITEDGVAMVELMEFDVNGDNVRISHIRASHLVALIRNEQWVGL